MTGIYARVSTQEQAKEGYSIGEQQDRLSKYASAMGWEVNDIYVDAGYSGASTDRPSLQRLIDDVKGGIIDRVLVYKLDRLSRSQKDTLHLIEDVFLANNCDFVSMCENFDTATPFGKAMIGILAVFAQLEREQIKERMMMGADARARSGGFHGRTPIGYDYDEISHQLVVNPYEAMQVRRIFDLFLSGVTIHAIVDRMDDDGYKHKYGSWIQSTIPRILRSRVYLGEIRWRDKWYKSTHEAIITEDMHRRSIARLDSIRDTYKSNSRTGRVKSLLGGLIFCERCGAKYSKIYFEYGGNKYYKYSCCSRNKRMKSLIKDPHCTNKNWNMTDLDNLILGEISKLNLEQNQTTPDQQDKSDLIKNEIASLDKQIERLIDLYSMGSIPKDVLEEKISSANVAKAKLTRTLSQERKNEDLRQEKEKLINSISDIIKNGSEADLRLLVTSLIDRIGIDGDDITIYWRI